MKLYFTSHNRRLRSRGTRTFQFTNYVYFKFNPNPLSRYGVTELQTPSQTFAFIKPISRNYLQTVGIIIDIIVWRCEWM